MNNEMLESERPSILAAPRIATPCLIVLLGSTAALTALETMRHMLTLRPQDQRRVAFVYIDTDSTPAPLLEFRRQHINTFLEYSLRIAVPAGISNVTPIQHEQHTFIRGKIPQYYANGAGGIRNNGHVAACFNYEHIYNLLNSALMDIVRLNTDQHGTRKREIQANIVTFIGGGTGSGILPDIAVMVRDLLIYHQYEQRINLFCMLPEAINGVDKDDLSRRKSNGVACLLELIAYSRAAAGAKSNGYEKYMWRKMQYLSNEYIANEVYLIGHANMTEVADTARIVGLDIFQRTTDASGVGFSEHSKWVDRQALGSQDERYLPTMFGTSCPLEVSFPLHETVTAFAQLAASSLLPLLAHYEAQPLSISDTQKREWIMKWNSIGRIDASNDPYAVKYEQVSSKRLERASRSTINRVWVSVDRQKQSIEQRIEAIFELVEQQECARIEQNPVQNAQRETKSILTNRISYLQTLEAEYSYILQNRRQEKEIPVPLRPTGLEDKLDRLALLPEIVYRAAPDYASKLSAAYNTFLKQTVMSAQYKRCIELLEDLLRRVRQAKRQAEDWYEQTGLERRARDLRSTALSSMAWRGYLEYPHPHQRHIFDLETLRRVPSGQNIAVERLYRWVASQGGSNLDTDEELSFTRYVQPCIDYLNRGMKKQNDTIVSIERQSASRLAERVVAFFFQHFSDVFKTLNLFDLLFYATPVSENGEERAVQIGGYLREHLAHMRGLMSSLVTFEAALQQGSHSTLNTSLYLGMNQRDGVQAAILQQVLQTLGSLSNEGHTPDVKDSLDPHRLQVSYGLHAISITTIRDFYLEHNSATEAYLTYQRAWDKGNGAGSMPVHSSGDAERLVTDPQALGYHQPLIELIIRRYTAGSRTGHGSSHGGAPAGDSFNPQPALNGQNGRGASATFPKTQINPDDEDSYDIQSLDY
ncbi:hypothetical protein KDH_12610 [Dictyobacter sp. S3.2.2.5]|uniref:Tubulin-like protein n=1 Tax=Dictyobacter halimunensis TaxID=3026934 RepID=A0ABQ6FL33_9CHLR|nr:hypothetical protein KDH_12610 [Dictyobacter sp. S3.2.2.5]